MIDISSFSDFVAATSTPGAWTTAQDGSSTGMFGGQPASGTTGAPGGAGAPPAGPAGGTGSGGSGNMMFIFLLPLLFLVLMSVWMNRKEKKKRETLLSAVGKQDVVLTVGGVIGTVMEIHDDRIVLRVDDNTKTKIAFARTSIQQVLRSAGAPAASAAETSIETKGKAEKSLT